jgi:ATP-binding cassette subfamily B protein
MGARIEHDMRNEIFGHYQKLSFAFFDNQKVGHLLSRITSDLFDISELLHHGPENIVISFIKLIGAMIILFVVNPMLACVPLVVIVVMLLFALVMNSRMKSAFKENRRRIADINSQIEDSLSGIRVVKSFGNETEEMRKFNAGNDRFVDSKKVSYRYMGIYNSGMGAFSTLITVISLIVGALLMTGGKLGAADLVTFLLYINNCTDPVKKLVNFTEQFQNGYSGYERFLEIMSIAPDIQDKPDALPLKNVQGEVTFENVSFHYEESKENVLSNVNLHVPAGDYVALVGSSGAGKTTLCSLLPRFYDVTEGRILLDGKDIRDVKLKDLRDEIGIVQQDVYLFAGTIIDNIRYGRPDATDEEVIRAAKAANAHEFIMELADGYDTDIGQRGVKLSGGQKQRLSIARVFLKNPPILIFDEATSALDNESEKVVQKSLELLAKDRTTFVIAHRLSTIRNAKRILVLTENGIAEEGTHKELLAKGGIYAHLYEMQF